MKPSLDKLFNSAQPFFKTAESAVMKLSADTAIEFCFMAATQDLLAARIEVGIWHTSGFEARLDCFGMA